MKLKALTVSILNIFLSLCALSIGNSSDLASEFIETAYSNGMFDVAKVEAELYTSSTAPDIIDFTTYSYSGYIQGETCFLKDEYLTSVMQYQLFILNFPESEYYSTALFKLGRTYNLLKEHAKAKKFYFKALSSTPDESIRNNSEYWQGRTFYETDDFTSATQSFNKVISSSLETDKKIDAYYWLGRSYIKQKEYAKAEAAFNQYVKFSNDDEKKSFSYYLMGLSSLFSQNYEISIRYFKKLINDYPNFRLIYDANYLIASIYFKLGKYDSSAVILTRLFSQYLETKSDSLYYISGEAFQKSVPHITYSLSSDKKEKEIIKQWWIDPAVYLLAWSYYNLGEDLKSTTFFEWAFYTSNKKRWKLQSQIVIGEIFYKLKNYPKSEEHFTIAINYGEENYNSTISDLLSEALYRIAWCCYKMDKWKESINYFDRILSVSENHIRKSEVTYLSARILYDHKQYTLAEKKYYDIINNFSDTIYLSEAYYGLSWIYYLRYDYKKALQFFDKFVSELKTINKENDRRKIIAKYQAGKCSFYLEDYADAISRFIEIRESYPNDPDYGDDVQYLIGASYQIHNKDYEQAIKEYKLLLSKYPDSRLAFYAQMNIGDCNFILKKYKEAINDYETADKIAMKSYEVESPALIDNIHYQIERAYYYLGIYKTPLDISYNFIKKYPKSQKSAELQLEIGNYYYEGKNYDTAIKEYKTVVDSFGWSPSAINAMYKIAESYYYKGDNQSAIKTYKELISLYPESKLAPQSQYRIGEIYLSMNNINQSIKEFQQIITNYPEDKEWTPKAYLRIGKCYMKLQKYNEARIVLSSLAEKKYDEFYICDAKLQILRSYYEEKDYKKALDLSSHIIEACTNEHRVETQYIVGECYFEQENYQSAMAEYKKVWINYPEYVSWHLFAMNKYAKCAEELKDWNSALSIYQQMLNVKSTGTFDENVIRKKVENLKKLLEGSPK